MKKHALVIGSGVASTAYVSVLDFNKIKTSVIGSPYELKEIQNLKKNKKIYVLEINEINCKNIENQLNIIKNFLNQQS